VVGKNSLVVGERPLGTHIMTFKNGRGSGGILVEDVHNTGGQKKNWDSGGVPERKPLSPEKMRGFPKAEQRVKKTKLSKQTETMGRSAHRKEGPEALKFTTSDGGHTSHG